MSDAVNQQDFPRGILFAALALISLSIAIAGLARYGGIGKTYTNAEPVVQSLDLTFADLPNGWIAVSDAASGRVIRQSPPGVDGFIRVVLRGQARERRLAGIPPEHPFKLNRFANDRLQLVDTGTGKIVSLSAFGANNARMFGQLFETRSASQ